MCELDDPLSGPRPALAHTLQAIIDHAIYNTIHNTIHNAAHDNEIDACN